MILGGDGKVVVFFCLDEGVLIYGEDDFEKFLRLGIWEGDVGVMKLIILKLDW